MPKPVGSLRGKITDKNTKEPLIGATIVIVGTYNSAPTDIEGNFIITNIHLGDYSIRISYVGYGDKQYNGINIKENEEKILDVTLDEAQNTLGEVVIEGEKNLIDLESGKSSFKVMAEDIKEMNVRDIQQLVALQPGVNQTPDGIQIRGGRVYETSYLIDGISAKDPLSGNGMGVGLSANSIGELNLVTGGAGAEYADAVSGVVAAKVKEGGSKLALGGSWITDKPRLWSNKAMGWNTDIANFYISGPFPKMKDKLTFFLSTDMQTTDDFTKARATQLQSSIMGDDKFWAPNQDNKWTATFKIAYKFAKGMKLTFTNQTSLAINQNTRTLIVQGFDQVMVPGFQYDFSLNMDNATTYTNKTNLTAINYKYVFAKGWAFDATLGRLFTNMRADANGRPFRPETTDRVLDPSSIVTDPVSVYNPDSPISLVNPGPGLYNNNGISTKWHDHYVQEYTINWKFSYASPNNRNFLTFGQQHKAQEMQWIDVKSPWVGAPITLPDGTRTPSSSIGSSVDVWKVNPDNGGFYISDEYKYKGISAKIGLRLDYWAYGKFADDAVNQVGTKTSVIDPQIAQDYKNQTTQFLGKEYSARLLPNVNVNFPVTDNNVLFFNYTHSKQLSHPLWIYQGLNPNYRNSSVENVGNPALRPEVTISYEIGVKSQITKNAGVTFTAFYNDKFDYVVSRTQTTKDITGAEVTRTIYFNQDYARIRGLEAVYSQRITNLVRATTSLTYQIATGKSNTAEESRRQIQNNGFVGVGKENYLAWDTPIDAKLNLIFSSDSNWRIGSVSMKGFRVFVSAVFKSNSQRYTKQYVNRINEYGRPEYVDVIDSRYTELSEPLFWTDLKISKDFMLINRASLALTLEFKNIFDNKNSQIINPVTGRAYYSGDQLPIDARDPSYDYPQAQGLPPNNPARFIQPRQMLIGLALSF